MTCTAASRSAAASGRMVTWLMAVSIPPDGLEANRPGGGRILDGDEQGGAGHRGLARDRTKYRGGPGRGRIRGGGQLRLAGGGRRRPRGRDRRRRRNGGRGAG